MWRRANVYPRPKVILGAKLSTCAKKSPWKSDPSCKMVFDKKPPSLKIILPHSYSTISYKLKLATFIPIIKLISKLLTTQPETKSALSVIYENVSPFKKIKEVDLLPIKKKNFVYRLVCKHVILKPNSLKIFNVKQ